MSDVIAELQRGLQDRYRVERELGAGGMATVYLARDLKHDRDVAIKVLHPDLGAALGSERFLAEIRTTAKLQHPHILPLLDSGAAGSLLFYVMPFIAGETLRSRLDRDRQLPIPDALRITREVADALGAAHALGIVHRDIKPENILLQGGHALVADFGIALAVQSAGGQRMTQTGLSLGTPQYMSPEQAMGEKSVDARSDIYALGAVAYEMLAGEPPFTGPSVQAIVARIMTEEPRQLGVQRRSVPASVNDAVMRALEKLPADRFESAAQFATALTQTDGTGRATLSGTRTGARPATGWKRAAVGLGAVALLLAVVTGTLLRRPAGTPRPTVYDVGLPDSAPLEFAARAGGFGARLRNLSIAPAATFAVYVARHRDSTTLLWRRSLTDASTEPIPGTQGATSPRISPDGARLIFARNGQLLVVPIGGGDPRLVQESAVGFSALQWISPKEVMAMTGTFDPGLILDIDLGQKRLLARTVCVLAQWLAKSGNVLCSGNGVAEIIETATGTSYLIRVAQPDGSPGPPLTGSGFRLVDDRYMVWASVDGDLRAAAYDEARRLVRRPVSVQQGIRREPIGDAQFDIAANGTLLFAPGTNAELGRFVRARSNGAIEPLPLEVAAFQRFEASRDGCALAAVTQALDGQELRVYDLRNGQRISWLKAEAVRHPVWSPTGDRLLVSIRDSTHWRMLAGSPTAGPRIDTLVSSRAEGSNSAYAPIEPVLFISDREVLAQDWSRETVYRFDPAVRPIRFDTVLVGARFASVSPDGRRLLFQSGAGTSRIAVTSYPVPGRQWQLAANGVEPLWLSDSEVLYREGITWYSIQLNASGEPAGAAVPWGRDPRFSDTRGWSNRLMPGGGIVYVQGPAQTSDPYLRVVPGWVTMMKAAVDAAGR